MIRMDNALTPESLQAQVDQVFAVAAPKIRALDERYGLGDPTPVFTVDGRYTTRGWTEWTQGFQFGCALLLFDGTNDEEFLRRGQAGTLERMATHVSHVGVHDHGFNNVSTYGNLLRMMNETRIPENAWQRAFLELALKVSGAVQAARWTELPNGLGFIQSFNGPHSLFADTIRSCRSLAVAHSLGHVLMGEQDAKINLLGRALRHIETTARYNVFLGEGRDSYDVRGRVAHESIFNVRNGVYRCPNSQQGFSPFTTWTRGLSWVLTGLAEQLEFLEEIDASEFDGLVPELFADKNAALERFREVVEAVADFHIENTPTDGIPYWDTGAPGLAKLGDYLNEPAKIDNPFEPVDSSAAAISAQGLLRLGNYLKKHGDPDKGERYRQAGLTTVRTLFSEDYLSPSHEHEGLILHSVYHQPNGWDRIPDGMSVPAGESTMWGDYHAMELAVYLKRQATGAPEYRFFSLP